MAPNVPGTWHLVNGVLLQTRVERKDISCPQFSDFKYQCVMMTPMMMMMMMMMMIMMMMMRMMMPAKDGSSKRHGHLLRFEVSISRGAAA